MVEIASLAIGDPAALWERLGFVIEGDTTWVSGIEHRLGSEGRGVIAWSLRGADGLDELPLADWAPAPRPTPPHPNGVIGLDHVVIATPDLRRTIEAFERHGVPLRRTREVGTPEQPRTQAFFRLGEAIAEVVGNRARSAPGPARFYGLAFTVADLDATSKYLGEWLRPAKPAVQPGRRIATLDWAAGSGVPIAFMSPGR